MGIYVYIVDMPNKVRGITVPCDDGYTVYINSKLTHEEQQRTYLHEISHIQNCDFDKFSVDEIEAQNKERKHYESRNILSSVY